MNSNTTPPTYPPQQTIIREAPQRKASNKCGTLGLVFSLVCLVTTVFWVILIWVPVFGELFSMLPGLSWLAGTVLSIIGLFKQPRGKAITGLCICIGMLIVIAIITITLVAGVGALIFGIANS